MYTLTQNSASASISVKSEGNHWCMNIHEANEARGGAREARACMAWRDWSVLGGHAPKHVLSRGEPRWSKGDKKDIVF